MNVERVPLRNGEARNCTASTGRGKVRHRRSDLLAPDRMLDDRLQLELGRGLLEPRDLALERLVVVHHHADPAGLRGYLVQHLEPLHIKLMTHDAEAGRVAARSRHRGHQAHRDQADMATIGISRVGGSAAATPGLPKATSTRAGLDQLRRVRRQPVGVAVCPEVLRAIAAAFLPSQARHVASEAVLELLGALDIDAHDADQRRPLLRMRNRR